MGVLAACRIALRFRNPWKNPRRDFSKAGSGNGISCLVKLEKFKFLVKIGKKYAKFLIMCYNFLL